MKQTIVIGGGIIGLSSALYLQRAGHKVTVLDKDDFKFTIGEYVSAGGTMRVTMVLKPVNGKFLIDSIIIERK